MNGTSLNILDNCDDFVTIGNIAILQKKTDIGAYDFDLRQFFQCRSVFDVTDTPVLLRIGAIDDYASIASALARQGMKLLVDENEHEKCSMIEKWYPLLKDKTPFTKIYDELPEADELLKDFSFPVFIKGNRQTNRHKRSQCIIGNKAEYNALRMEWKRDSVLYWQKAAVREYVPLLEIDSRSFPSLVPISYEFRFFYFEGKCMAYGPYWTMGKKYSLHEEELSEVLRLTDWAAEQLKAAFPAIDVAKTAAGEWIIIEVNDAQECGYAGVNPMRLWNNAIDTAKEKLYYNDELFTEGAVVMTSDPLPDMSAEDMWKTVEKDLTSQELADAFAGAHNKFIWVEDDIYDFEEGTERHKKAYAVYSAWKQIYMHLETLVISRAKAEGLFLHEQRGLLKQIEKFMEKYGYRDGNGWWVRL